MILKFLHKTHGKCCSTPLSSAADFVRLYWGQHYHTHPLFNDRNLFDSYHEGTKFSFLSVSLKEDSPVELVLLPAAIYCGEFEKDDLLEMVSTIRDKLTNCSDHAKIFLAALTKEDGILWKDYLHQCIEIPEGVSVLYGLLGTDEFWDDSGEVYSLSEYIRQLSTVSEPSVTAEPIEETAPEEIPAVEEFTPEEIPAAEEPTPEEIPAVEELTPEEIPAVEELTPEEIPAVEELTPEGDLTAFYQKQMYQLFQEGQFPSALTISRALSLESDALHQEYTLFAYAADDPATEKSYRGSELQTVFAHSFGENAAMNALCLAAHLRMFFSQDPLVERNYLHSSLTTLDQYGMFDRFPTLKSILYDLQKCFNNTNTTLHPEILSLLVDSKDADDRRIQYLAKIDQFLASKPDQDQKTHRRIYATFNRLFGSDSKLIQALDLILKEGDDAIPLVREIMDHFLLDPSGFSGECLDANLDKDAIERYVIDAWEAERESVSSNKNDNFKNPSRSTAIRRVEEAVKAAMSWVGLSAGGSNLRLTAEHLSYLDAERKKIAEQMFTAAELCLADGASDTEKVAAATLSWTLRELAGWLTEGYSQDSRTYFYLEFLRDNRIELNESYIPHVEENFLDISPLSICKRVLKHSRTELPEWPEVLRRIFEQPEEGCDFGHAELIRDYLKTEDPAFVLPGHFDASVEAARKRMEDEVRTFQARLDLGENYGWIDDPAKIDRILADMETRYDHYLYTRNFGFYFRTTQAYLKEIMREAENRKAGYQAELERLRTEKGPWPIFEEISDLIQKQMYTIAQDYMDQARNGTSERPQSQHLNSTGNAFQVFLNQYDTLWSTASRVAREGLLSLYKRKTRPHNIQDSGEEMLKNWLRSESRDDSGKLAKFFENMGLSVASVTKKENGGYHVSFRQPKEPKADYPHPIGPFGSEMIAKGLEIFLVFGSQSNATMQNKLLSQIPAYLDSPALILADTHLSLADRRRLAHKIKTENLNLTPYLILDWVLLLHLAEFPKLERWLIFLKCALPFHYCNPYTENSTSELCPDMFIGRRDELRSIVDPHGANIIYGGRQLGKTALLKRARDLMHIPQNGRWAIYLDIKKCATVDAAAARVYEELREGFLGERSEEFDASITWDALADKIVRRMNDPGKPVTTFLLLLDEADAFLRACGEDGHNFEAIDCIKQIQNAMGNRFKFVFAGLHKVLQIYNKATTDKNSPIPYLSAITIKPLPFDEARELMALPLSYLGFMIREEDSPLIAQVLSSTNYYPGLIQYYCSRLLQAVSRDTQSDVNQRPPYWLEENKILTLLKDPAFQSNIKEKFMFTLGIDADDRGYYTQLAYALAYCYFQQEEDMERGYTAEDIRRICNDMSLSSIASLSHDQISILLGELIELNVLRSRERYGEIRYIFNRPSFRHMLGNKDQVEDELLSLMEKEGG